MSEDNRPIQSRDSWRGEACNNRCIVKDWEIIIVKSEDNSRFLYGTVVNDIYNRFPPGGYVFSGAIYDFDENTGLISTANSLYALVGNGEELTASLDEAYKMKMVGQSLHTIRGIEKDIGPIVGRED
jgi:hypothetical protein